MQIFFSFVTMARLKRKDFSGWHGIILPGLFILNCYLLNKLFFFIPQTLGWMNESVKLNDPTYFMPLKTFLCLIISLPLTLMEIGFYFRFTKRKRYQAGSSKRIKNT